jgi:hypothetical protein
VIIQLPFLPWDINIERRLRDNLMDPNSGTLIKNRNYEKIFCIGFGKTGTTSLGNLLSLFGFRVGNQAVAEVLSRDWLIHKDADRIIRYCYTADAFQDAPFGYPELYKELDVAFPGSKFILTVRNSPEEWFESLVRFHTKLFSSDPERPPTKEDLENANYRYKGYMLESQVLLYGYPKTLLYDEEVYKSHYIKNNSDKREYFKSRPHDFIEINVAIKDDFCRLCEFLNIETNLTDFPWLNKS